MQCDYQLRTAVMGFVKTQKGIQDGFHLEVGVSLFVLGVDPY